jgi:cytochrome oxidase Cu insertion factor (SCO1/SenC/PrrC family)
VQQMLATALAREDKPNAAELRKTLADYDLTKMDSARLGELAPNFVLTDHTGKPRRLSEFRGKTVVLRFILFDY